MEIQVKELEYCKLHVSCVANGSEIETKRNEILKIFKKAPVPGFRKGKAGTQVIKSYYKAQIDDSLKKALAEEALHQSMFEKQFKPLSNPQFTEIFLQPTNFSCQFVIYKKPDLELQDWKSFEIPTPHQAMTQNDYAQKTLQELRVRHGDRVPFSEDNFIETGDVASVKYDAYVDGEKKEDLSSSEGDVLTVGSSRLADFDTNLLGMKVGETREFEVNISNSSKPEIDGKKVKFVVTLNMGMRVVPCPLDDEFAKKLGKNNLEELNEAVQQNAFAAIEGQNRAAKQNAISQRLVSGHDFQVPEWMAIKEAQHMAATSKLDWNTFTDQTKENYIAQSNKNIKLSLILEKIRDSEPEAQLSDSELIEVVRANLSTMTDKPLEEVMRDLNNAGYLQVLFNRIKDEYTLNFAVKTVKFI
jgi:trigger factor